MPLRAIDSRVRFEKFSLLVKPRGHGPTSVSRDILRLVNMSSSSSSSRAPTHEILSSMERKLLQTIKDNLLCLVCHKLVVDPVDLGCDHIFCQICLRERLFKKNECPECKAFAQPKDITKSLFVDGVVNAYLKIEAIAMANPSDSRDEEANIEEQIHKPVDDDMSNMLHNNNNSSSSSSSNNKNRQSQEEVVEVPDTYADDAYDLGGPAVDTQATRLSNCSNRSDHSPNVRRNNKDMVVEVPDTYADENFDLNMIDSHPSPGRDRDGDGDGDEMEIERHHESRQANPFKAVDVCEDSPRHSHDSTATCTEVEETLVDSEENQDQWEEVDEVAAAEVENIRMAENGNVHNTGMYPSANDNEARPISEKRLETKEEEEEEEEEEIDEEGKNHHNDEEEEDWVESYCSQQSPNLLSPGRPIDIVRNRKRMYEDEQEILENRKYEDAMVDENVMEVVAVPGSLHEDIIMDDDDDDNAMEVVEAVRNVPPPLKVYRHGESQFPDTFDDDGDDDDRSSMDNDSMEFPNTCADMLDQIIQVTADIEKTIDEFKTLQ